MIITSANIISKQGVRADHYFDPDRGRERYPMSSRGHRSTSAAAPPLVAKNKLPGLHGAGHLSIFPRPLRVCLFGKKFEFGYCSTFHCYLIINI